MPQPSADTAPDWVPRPSQLFREGWAATLPIRITFVGRFMAPDRSDSAGGIPYVFFAGQRVARVGSTGAVHYYFSDHLGTHAVVENATGTACEQDVDYYPYGGEQSDYCTTPVAQNYKFNGKERDVESGLDNFGARYNTSNLGRFMTPDWAAEPEGVPNAELATPRA